MPRLPLKLSRLSARAPSRKSLAIGLTGLLLAYLLFGWLALPLLLQTQASRYLAGKTGYLLSMDKPVFNPLTLRLQLRNVALLRPDKAPLLAFRELSVRLSPLSLLRAAYVFGDIQLDGLEANASLQPGGRLNWSDLIDALKDPDADPDAPPPRLLIQHLQLRDAHLRFADQRRPDGFVSRIEPINIALDDISTLPSDTGDYSISARTDFGAKIAWQGRLGLAPLAMTGRISAEDMDMARLGSSLLDALPIAPPAGKLNLAADYRLSEADKGKLQLELMHMAGRLSGLQLQAKAPGGPQLAVAEISASEGRYDLQRNHFALPMLTVNNASLALPGSKPDQPALALGRLVVEQLELDLAGKSARLGRLGLEHGQLQVRRDSQGRIDLLQALPNPQPTTAGTEPVAGPSPARWRYQLDQLALNDFATTLRDETVSPAAELALADFQLQLNGISDDLSQPLPLQLSLKARDGGSLTAQGSVVPATPGAELQLKLSELNLAPLQPYLAAIAKLDLAEGRLSGEGRARYGAQGGDYRGSLALQRLRLNEAGTDTLFLGWESLASRSLVLTPAKLGMSDLLLDGLNTKLIIAKDKSVSIKRILKQTEPEPAASPAPAAKPAKPFLVNIERLRLRRGELDYADYSLALPFGSRIHDLEGAIVGLSSRPDSRAQIELDGQVDEYGLARAAGQLSPANPTDFMDLKVVFRNIEMTRLTPYSATFAGHKIASGKLSLDLEYKIQQRQLLGDNKVIMDQLTLGEKVDSPDATSLPLGLAIAILQDSDGRIDLGLPVSGSLDDPQFSYGGIIWKALVNVVSKIATAPFRALGALFGGGEKFDSIAFEPGDASLTPPEREKLARLAGAMAKRPGLQLEIHGTYADADRAALQDRLLRRSLLSLAGQRLEAGDADPGPIATQQPTIRSALEQRYAEQFGSGELAALQAGFRQANPGQLPESTSSKMLSRLGKLFGKQAALDDQQVAQLKGADFYLILYERLRAKVVVDEARLQALAKTRGEATVQALQAAGAPTNRLSLLTTDKVNAEGTAVPIKLGLAVAAKPAGAP